MAACRRCGHQTTPGARWCNQCGTPVPDVSLGSRASAGYDPPALIDVPAAPVESGARPTRRSGTVAGGPPPPPPAGRAHTQVLPIAPPVADPADDRDRRPPVGILVGAAAALIVVLTLIAVVLLNGDDTPDRDDQVTAGGDAETTTPVELAPDANVEVPKTAKDGKDAQGNDVSYAAANLTDGDPTTTWRMKGNAKDDELVVTWSSPVTIAEVGMVNGYAKVDEATGDERYGENRRVLAATWIFDDGTELSRTLEETTHMQTFRLDAPVQTSSVTIRIDETSKPGGRNFTAISELSFLSD